MNYSRRVAVWLLTVSVQLVRLFVYCGRLEMISVWLLFVKLLRATAGVRRPTGNELNEGSSVNQQQQEQEYLAEAVTMETSKVSEMANITDRKMDPGCTDDQKCQFTEEEEEEVEKECFDTYFSECLDTKSTSEEDVDGQECKVTNDCEGSGESDESIDSQEGVLVMFKEEQQSDCKESESHDNSHVNEQPEEENKPLTICNAHEEAHSELQEEVKTQETFQDTEQDDLSDCVHVELAIVLSDSDVEEPCRSVASPTLDQEEIQENVDVLGLDELEISSEERQEDNAVTAETNDGVLDTVDMDESMVETKDRVVDTVDTDNELTENTTETVDGVLDTMDMAESTVETEENVLDIINIDESTAENEDRVLDMDTNNMVSEDTGKPEDGVSDTADMDNALTEGTAENQVVVLDTMDMEESTAETKNKILDIMDPDKTVTEGTAEPEHEVLDITLSESDILEQPDFPTECELQDISLDSSAHYCSLTKIPEDEGELEKSSMHNLHRLSCSTSELDKKLPEDFCVVQDIKSENVSTEHLDFRVARRQWQKIEEQTKGQVHRPVVRHGSCQSSHSFMYTPVRHIDRPRKDNDTDNLSLGDNQYTQFSPCSEDSGLDDTSYRSPYDEPENPVEREIREALEREENFRHERAMAKTSACTRPIGLPHSRSEPGERGRMFNTPEDRCRSQRSSRTNSSVRSPTYHEMTANNVIILEPDPYPASPRNRGKGGLLSPGTSSFQEWPSDSNNVIILETSNLIIRSASEFCLSTACQETQESTFHNNPFFKLRSHSTQSLVDQEIKIVKQREEELKRQRAQLYAKERYDTVLVSPSHLQNFTYERTGEHFTAKSKSSPSSPSKTRKMDRSTLSCDNKVPGSPFSRVRRKSALVQRWEAGIFANHQPQD